MRTIKFRPSPYSDARGNQIWEGNTLRSMLTSFDVVCLDGVWYGVDQVGWYIDNSNRYHLLSTLTHLEITDDTAVARTAA